MVYHLSKSQISSKVGSQVSRFFSLQQHTGIVDLEKRQWIWGQGIFILRQVDQGLLAKIGGIWRPKMLSHGLLRGACMERNIEMERVWIVSIYLNTDSWMLCIPGCKQFFLVFFFLILRCRFINYLSPYCCCAAFLFSYIMFHILQLDIIR